MLFHQAVGDPKLYVKFALGAIFPVTYPDTVKLETVALPITVRLVDRFNPGLITEYPDIGVWGVNASESLLKIPASLLLTNTFPTTCGVVPVSITVLALIAVTD